MLQKDYYAAVEDYTNAILHGIVKIASKMGISTLQSYQGSQIFEAIGINSDVIEKYFTNTVSRVEGISLKDLEADVDARHGAAFDPLGLENDLTLEVQEVTNIEVEKNSIYTIHRRSIHFRLQQEQEVMICLNNILI